MLFESYNYITTIALLSQFIIYKFFFRQSDFSISNKYLVSHHIINVFYNFFLFRYGILGVIHHETKYYAEHVLFIHKSNQLYSIIYETPSILLRFIDTRGSLKLEYRPLMFFHHLLLFTLIHILNLNDYAIDGINLKYIVCLYAGVCELSSIFLGLSRILNKHPYFQNNSHAIFNIVELFLKISFCISFISIRVIWWSYNTPRLIYISYLVFGHTIESVILLSFQVMQYYWAYMIFKHLRKHKIKNKDEKINKSKIYV